MPDDPTIGRPAVQAEILSILSSIDGVENVYTEDQAVTTIQRVHDLLVQSDKEFVQYWTIHRTQSMPHVSTNDRGNVVIGTQVQWYHTFRLKLHVGRRVAASESHFQSLIDSVLHTFQNRRTLGAWNPPAPLSLVQIFDDNLADMKIHRAEFEVKVIVLLDNIAPLV